jgi:hypothetical protein
MIDQTRSAAADVDDRGRMGRARLRDQFERRAGLC